MEYSKKWNIPRDSIFSFTIFCDVEKIVFEIFKISKNNIIISKLAKVIGLYSICAFNIKWTPLFKNIALKLQMNQNLVSP